MGLEASYGDVWTVATLLNGPQISPSTLRPSISVTLAMTAVIVANIVQARTPLPPMCPGNIGILLTSLLSLNVDQIKHVSITFSAVIKSKMKKDSDGFGGFLWRCLDCGHTSKRTTDLTKHIEAKHIESAGYDCGICGKHCPSKNSLTAHMSRQHRKVY
eukprot:TRINITY_DN74940_c0_g1_i1.p1 TRINITY_DN74940_c0_g1~~TRINITY_DN74940_c0_g1_i1.p1  ORF type:complete len:159 (-),score=18.49 TRINITY_DN74940_c0_g1_i1:80-556(-)